jgi:hypothetical protein
MVRNQTARVMLLALVQICTGGPPAGFEAFMHVDGLFVPITLQTLQTPQTAH